MPLPFLGMCYYLRTRYQHIQEDKMRLAQLKYFVEICDSGGNMTRAAEKLHVSQPALSKAVRDLEEELGVLLFKRIKQRIELTADGNYFLGRVKDILRQVDELPELMHRQKDAQLLLGIHPSLSYFMFDFLSDFSADYPEITVLMSNAYNKRHDLIESVNSGKMDAAVIVFNSTKNYPDEGLFRIINLKKTKVVYVVSRNHPLAGRKTVGYADIASYPLYGHTTHAANAIMSMGIQAKLIVNTHDLRNIGEMVRQQKGGAILLRELAQAIPGSAILELEDNISANVAVVVKKEPPPSKLYVVDSFLDYVDKNKERMMYLFNN